MIRFKTGDILAEDAEALVNTVNCVGVMGRGIALQFKKAFPENFRVYADACARGGVRPGRMFVFETGALTNPRYIINFPTKRHWRGNSRIEDINAGLKDLATVIREHEMASGRSPCRRWAPASAAWNGAKCDRASRRHYAASTTWMSSSSNRGALPRRRRGWCRARKCRR